MSERSSGLTVDIEGLIGVPEWWQFENEDQRIATYEKFREKISEIAQAQAKKITVNIRSIGGNVQDALLIYDALCGLDAEITTSCHGYVASAATIIAQAASEGKRLISSNALYLIHNATTTVEGNSREVEHTARLLDKTDDRISEIYASRSGRPVEQFRELMARGGGQGEWLSPEEVLEYGLADKVSEVSPLASVRQKVRDFFGRSGGSVSNAFLRLLEVPETAPKEDLEMVQNLSEQVVVLQNRLQSLESENARLQARPSATLPKEDPAVTTDVDPAGVLAGNRSAYESDLRAFRAGY